MVHVGSKHFRNGDRSVERKRIGNQLSGAEERETIAPIDKASREGSA